jgi:hypothetical protein
MLVRTYRSQTKQIEFQVHEHEAGTLSCTCKEYRDGVPGRRSRICRHIRAFLAEPHPFENLDWL